MAELTVNRNYKDCLFRMLFREKPELLSLYNAVNQTSYDNPEDLEILTLENTIYMSMKNDSSFLIEEHLNLYEAQSTLNPNMPLRGVFYLAELYKGYIVARHLDIYSGVRLKLPSPRYLVFYNGTARNEESWAERLSDSFVSTEKETPALECTALVLNINYGKNKQLMASCRKLYEYSYFIEEIRKDLRTGLRLTQAVDRAMERCISEGILEDFLSIHRAEVKNVILEEYDEELHIKSEKKLSYDEGELANARAYILRLLELRGAVPDDLKERIQAETDIETLNQWFLLSAKTASVDEFRKKAAI